MLSQLAIILYDEMGRLRIMIAKLGLGLGLWAKKLETTETNFRNLNYNRNLRQ